MNRQRRLLLASLLSISVGLALANGGGGMEPAPSQSQAVEDAKAEAETMMDKEGLSDAEKRYVRWSVRTGTVRKAKPAAKLPILDLDKPVLDGDLGIPQRRTIGGDTTNIIAIDRIIGPDVVVVEGGKAWIKGVPTKGMTADSTIELPKSCFVDGFRPHTTRLGKKVDAPYLVAVDAKRIEAALNSGEVGKWLSAKAVYDEAEALRVAAAARKGDAKAPVRERTTASQDRIAQAAKRKVAKEEEDRKRLEATNGLVLKPSGQESKSGRGGFVSGTVQNTNKRKLTNVRITFDLFKKGVKTGTATDKISSLDTGKPWSFKAPSRGKEFDEYKLAELTGK